MVFLTFQKNKSAHCLPLPALHLPIWPIHKHTNISYSYLQVQMREKVTRRSDNFLFSSSQSWKNILFLEVSQRKDWRKHTLEYCISGLFKWRPASHMQPWSNPRVAQPEKQRKTKENTLRESKFLQTINASLCVVYQHSIPDAAHFCENVCLVVEVVVLWHDL